jgi:hypothetical protein
MPVAVKGRRRRYEQNHIAYVTAVRGMVNLESYF